MRWVRTGAATVAAGLVLGTAPAAHAGWVGTWTAPPLDNPYPTGTPRAQPPLDGVLQGGQARDQSIRQVVHTTLGGTHVRLTLSNAEGTAPLTFGAVELGRDAGGGKVARSTTRFVTFRGRRSVTIPPGRTVRSDAMSFRLRRQEDVAVSLHVRGASGAITWHPAAFAHSWLSRPGAGDHTAETSARAYPHSSTSWFWLTRVDVRAPGAASAVAVLGDSISDGNASTLDANDRWPDVLADRMLRARRDLWHAVLNASIGGNTITRLPCDVCGAPALDRLDRDVLRAPGVRHVLLFEGTNDIRRGASAAQVIAGMQEIIRRVRARGLRIIGATILPRADVPQWNPAVMNPIRREVNAWIRRAGAFDAIVDFDRIVRDPADPDRMRPEYDVNSTIGGPGDHLHPGRPAFLAMGYHVPLSLFRER